ncbi:Voltage-gated hydrogen channel 1 [Fasciolopsis buskii]|uniref:Voltage-gated hydrogen channel 1 n=1 Tax=Fasciolopsis buskii TaxID=27845 RepID=A0A8E0S840_9TREM|nr:Voltage-gated hydrogen channel 1 [Fasciolopsis buski]
MSRYLDRQPAIQEGRPKSNVHLSDDVEVGLMARQSSIRARKPGRCSEARKRLKHVFHMRKYYRSIMGLTGIEAILVIIRLMLETEALRYPPGNTRTALLSTQLGLFCISLFTLFLFVIEQPFKWWALGSRRFCTSVMFVLDAIACFVCFSLDIYNIYANVTRPDPEVASPKQLVLCKMSQLVTPAESGITFAIVGGLTIVVRLWCIAGYIQKTVQDATLNLAQKLGGIQKAHEEAEVKITQLGNMLREQEALNRSNHSRGSARTSGPSNTQTRTSSTNRRSQDPRSSRSTTVT